jgi:hypothetical protein
MTLEQNRLKSPGLVESAVWILSSVGRMALLLGLGSESTQSRVAGRYSVRCVSKLHSTSMLPSSPTRITCLPPLALINHAGCTDVMVKTL